MNLSKISEITIEYSFYLLFILVPLIWLPINYELFEFNKMILTYIFTIVIVAAWIVKSVNERNFKFVRTALDIPILLFLFANVLSTVFSIDPHTSLYGFYSRFNGGLLSILSYSLLYFALTNNFNKEKAKNLLLVGIGAGFLVAIYGILQHPNFLFSKIENGQRVNHGIDYKYWAEAVEIRVFSTLGQPNWLAAYLAMLLPLSVSAMLVFQKVWLKIVFLTVSVAFYLTITYTLSRGGTLGLIGAGVVFSLFLLVYGQSKIDKIREFFHLRLAWKEILQKNYLWLAGFIVVVLLINSNLGNAISLRGSAVNPAQVSPKENSGQTQLEIGGSETGQIRLIVWSGALDTFRHYPVFGTGVETFGFSYYLFRPVEHNLTKEWDFLYNKAHNEYLNYLSTTGIVGFSTYLLLIGIFVFWSIRYLLKTKVSEERFWVLALFSAFVGYLIQNFFGFSVVPIAIFFFLFPALAFLIAEEGKETNFFDKSLAKYFKEKLARQAAIGLTLVFSIYLLLFVGQMWLADTFYAQGFTSDSGENYKNLKQAHRLFPGEPIFSAELAGAAASLASQVDDGKLKNDLIKEAFDTNKKVTSEHRYNTGIARNSLQTLFTLSQIDKKYWPDALTAAENLGKLAPSDASIQYNLALVYHAANKDEAALKQLDKVLKLKPDYQDAKDLKKKLSSG